MDKANTYCRNRFISKIIQAFFLLLSLLNSFHINASEDRYASNSILANGKWIKFPIKETGIYRISYSEIKKLGFSDPSKISVYGYGGYPLDEDFRKKYMDDLPQLSVWRGDDYLLFYGRGTVKWEFGTDEYNSKIDRFVHTNNPYSEYGYYFLCDHYDKATTQVIKSNIEAGLRISSFDDYYVHEVDRISLNKSGRELYGESFYNPIQEFRIDNVHGITNEAGQVEMRFIAKCSSEQSVAFFIDDNLIFNARVPKTTGTQYTMATAINPIGGWTGNKSNNFKAKIHFSQSGNNTAYLDYVRFQFKRELKVYDQPFTFFRSLDSKGQASRFIIQNANQNTLVFDVSDGINMKQIETKLNGTELSFTIPQENTLREFVLVQLDKKFPSVDFRNAKEIPNQNLHSTLQKDYIIISPDLYLTEALRLAKFHYDESGLEYIVVSPEKIYNEFSSGTPDATAYRRFVKMFYDRSISIGKPPKYLLLFGDGAFDNRFITPEWSAQKHESDKYLLTYQTKESLDEDSHVVDDYFGFLDDHEGKDINSDVLDIGVGRFPVSNLKQAKQSVDKVIYYMSNNFGKWKNNLCFVADDGSSQDNFTTKHQEDMEKLTQIISKNKPEYIISKYHFDAYRRYADLGYPDVRKGIQKSLNEGTFLINYVGHGNTMSWGDEKVLTQNDILQARYSQLPIWITATCDFCRFDSPTTSAGEDVFLNPKSGGIALITTSRVAYSSYNEQINRELINILFDSERKSTVFLGDVIKNTKARCSSIGRAKLGFCLIGDPALKIHYPEHSVEIREINNKPVGSEVIFFKAMEKSSFNGVVLKPDGKVDENFNGEIDITIFDNKDTFTTLGNHTVKVIINGASQNVVRKIDYEDYRGKIYTGKHLVKNGYFETTFVVTKNISYSAKNNGKFCMYAYDEQDATEASGSFTAFYTGGSSENPVVDNNFPEIRLLYLNDTTFVDGAKVNSTPYFFAKVWDESGINTTGSSLGHDIYLMIDNQFYNLNEYYEPSFEVEGEGYIRFSIPEQAEGIHEAEFIISDVMNNTAKEKFTFMVDKSIKPNLYKILATPNPARQYVEFTLNHNRPESTVKIEIQVFDLSGKMLWSHKETGSSRDFKDYIVSWDLTGNSGNHLPIGLYFYRATISTKGSKEATKAEKLLILNP